MTDVSSPPPIITVAGVFISTFSVASKSILVSALNIKLSSVVMFVLLSDLTLTLLPEAIEVLSYKDTS